MLMSPSSIRVFLPLVALFGLTQATWAALQPAPPVDPQVDPAQVEFFEKRIRPVLADKCYKCHSSEATKVKGGLLLDTREGIRNGGDTGPAVVPGNAKESLLLKAIHWQDKDLRMPPEKDGGKLPDNVIADFEKWIAMGAPDPRGAGTKVARREMDLTKAKKLWTFQTPQAAPVPAVKDTAWPKSDVDRFLLAAQEAKGLHPVADADRPTLLRRVYFDLIGLPPTPAQIEAFVKDKSPYALAKVVDVLLASPQFGERWGRHWLDTARYAESTGKERNFTFPEAWRYRDWVIAAFNADKPYNQFIVEQIAGDLLPAKNAAEHDQNILATGFLAVGTKGLNEKNKEIFKMDVVDDQIDTTSRAVLGLTVACARCHDHKFDPIPTKDYYALAGIFRSTTTYYGTNGPGGAAKNRNASTLIALTPPAGTEKTAGAVKPPPPAAPATAATPPVATAALVPASPAPAPAAPATSPAAAAPAQVAEAQPQLPPMIANNPAMAERFAKLPPKKREQLLARFGKAGPQIGAAAPAPAPSAVAPAPAPEAVPSPAPASTITAPSLPAFIANDPEKAKKFAALPASRREAFLAKFANDGKPKFAGKQGAQTTPDAGETTGPKAMGVADGYVSDAAILIRGEVEGRGAVVPRGVVSVLTMGEAPAMPAKSSGRLELAQWLTAPENPLTARVMVNRVWQHLFGEGIVRTADNFGATGEEPTNAALLDTLALQFMRDSWSVKKLIRSLVLTRTYQLGGAPDARGAEIDPDNRLLWHASSRRLDAEAIRDAMLVASGKIDLRPLEGSVVAKTGDGYIGRGIRPETFTNVNATYRSVYLPIVRDFVPEALDIFDFAEPSLVVATRDVTNVPVQALYLLNNSFVREQASAMARHILAQPLSQTQRITLAYQTALSRLPTDAERARAEQYLIDEAAGLAAVIKGGKAEDAAALSWSTFCQALFASAEFRYLK